MSSSSLWVADDGVEGNAERPRKRSMYNTTCRNCSPYFASSPTSSKLKAVSSHRAHKRHRSSPKRTTKTSSPHFSDAPSSVLGSLATLGPIFFTWTELSPSSICTNMSSRCAEVSTNSDICQRSHRGYIQSYSSITPCNSEQHNSALKRSTCEFCQVVIQDAIRHFSNKCDVFDRCYDSKLKEYGYIATGARPIREGNVLPPDSCFSSRSCSQSFTSDDPHVTLRQRCTIEPSRQPSSSAATNLDGASQGSGKLFSCLEVAAIAAEESVRHLCVNGCYLKAYSPCRDWIELRQAIHHHTDVPVDEVLHGWKVVLQGPIFAMESYQNMEISQDESKHLISVSSSCVKTTGTQSANKKTGRNMVDTHLPRTIVASKSAGKSYSSHRLAVRALLHGATDDFSTPHLNRDSISDNTALENLRGFSGGLHHRRALFVNKKDGSSFSFVSTSNPKTNSLPVSSLAANGTPYSPLGLIEELFSDDPWKLLMSTIFLNRTRRIQVDRILCKFFERYPTPQDVIAKEGSEAEKSHCDNEQNEIEIRTMIRPLGFNHRRAKGIVQFTRDYVQLIEDKKLMQHAEERTEELCESHVKAENSTKLPTKQETPEFEFSRKDVESLYQCGKYAADAYQIFIRDNWDNSIQPTDHALRAYVEWKKNVNLVKEKR